MSALGHKRTFGHAVSMSALPLKADMAARFMSTGPSPSRDADPDRLDDLGPPRRVALDQGSELRRRGMGRRDAQRRKARRKLVRVENGFQVRRQARGDLRRKAGGSEHAPPMLDDEIDAAFPERRNTRARRQPRFACDRERANAIENRARRRERGEARLHVTGDQIIHGRARAAKRHMHELDASSGLKKLRGEVGGATDTARGDGVFSGSAFASATKSRAVSAFTAGLTKKNIEAVPIRPIGVKSRTGSAHRAAAGRVWHDEGDGMIGIG